MSKDTSIPYSQRLNERGFKRSISVSAVDVENGEITVFDEKNTPFDEFYLAVTASSAMPGVFPPVRYKGHLLMDGGVAYNTQVD